MDSDGSVHYVSGEAMKLMVAFAVSVLLLPGQSDQVARAFRHRRSALVLEGCDAGRRRSQRAV